MSDQRAVLRDTLAQAADTLQEAGVPSPQVDAAALAAHALGLPQLVVATAPPLPPDFGPTYRRLVARRAAREPLQHIIGSVGFRYLTLRIAHGVFCPRPETEVVAQAAVDEARAVAETGRAPLIVDLGCGSGAIALSVANEVPSAWVAAVDLAPVAVELTRVNRELLDLPAVRVEHGDAQDPDVLADLDGDVDVVVTNPPYIPLDAVIRDPEVAEHDPALALWSGADGLELMRGIERRAGHLLRPGALLVAEHGDAQGASAPDVFTGTGRWREVTDHEDLATRPRFVTARRAGGERVTM